MNGHGWAIDLAPVFQSVRVSSSEQSMDLDQ